jgi:hypothetical protein
MQTIERSAVNNPSVRIVHGPLVVALQASPFRPRSIGGAEAIAPAEERSGFLERELHE